MPERVDENYTRRQMKQIKIYLIPEDAEALNEYCKKHNVSKQELLESYIRKTVQEDEEYGKDDDTD